MASITVVETRPTGTVADGSAYFESSTNKFLVYDATNTSWLAFNSDGTGAAGYALDSNYEISYDSAPLLHLDASDLSLSDGASVTTWSDRSGNGYDFTGTGSNAPVFKTSGRVGHNTVLFDGTDDFMTNSSVLGQFGDQNATLIAVYNQYDSDTFVDFFDTGAYGGGDRLSPDYSSAFLATRIENISENFIKPVFGNNIFGVRVDSSASSYELFFNNASQYQTGSYNFGVTSTMSIGGGNTTYKFNGEISEVLLFNQALSDEDWNTIHSYLANKYSASNKTVLSGSYALDNTYSVSASPTFHFSPESEYLLKPDRTQASANDDNIIAWRDKSRGLQLTGVDATLNPTLKTNHINGNNALYFNGDVLIGPGRSMLNNYSGSSTLIFAFDANGDASTEPIGFPVHASNRLINNSSTGYMGNLRRSRLSAQPHGVDINNPHITTITTDISSNYYRIFGNGGSPVTNTTASNPDYNSNTNHYDLILGANNTAGTGYPLNGYIYEILFFDTALSDADMNAVGGYLGAKYGITYTNI